MLEKTSWSGCPECRKERALAFEKQCRREEEDRHITALLNRTHIPARFANKTFDNYRADNAAQKLALDTVRTYIDEFEANLKDGRCLVFVGKPGTGKTHLACAIISALAQSGRSAIYTTVSDLIRALRETWCKDSERTEKEVLREYTSPQLLILDEVGVQYGTEAELTQLTEVMDLRYRDIKPTLVISNLDKQGLLKCLDERAVDRLRESGKMLTFDWESRRGLEGNQ